MNVLNKKTLPQRAVILWRVRVTLLLIAAAFLCGVFFVFSNIIALIFGIGTVAIYLVLMFLYFPYLYKSYVYGFSFQEIFIQKGVLFHKNIHIRMDRIQYCVLVQGPLQRLFGLASVLILTAGSQEYIRDIHVKNAEKLRKVLVQNENE